MMGALDPDPFWGMTASIHSYICMLFILILCYYLITYLHKGIVSRIIAKLEKILASLFCLCLFAICCQYQILCARQSKSQIQSSRGSSRDVGPRSAARQPGATLVRGTLARINGTTARCQQVKEVQRR